MASSALVIVSPVGVRLVALKVTSVQILRRRLVYVFLETSTFGPAVMPLGSADDFKRLYLLPLRLHG